MLADATRARVALGMRVHDRALSGTPKLFVSAIRSREANEDSYPGKARNKF